MRLLNNRMKCRDGFQTHLYIIFPDYGCKYYYVHRNGCVGFIDKLGEVVTDAEIPV
jgi:hypothetical protein